MMILLDELINGWVLSLPDNKPEYFETKREALQALEHYINSAQIHELNLLIEGSGKIL
jgi:hypothetical protein